MTNVRVLILDAGVIGSFYAARLKEVGHDITLLARGQRLTDLRDGIVLKDFLAVGVPPPVSRSWTELGPDDAYDLAIVAPRLIQSI
jgi:2-dehydropantoate 2-reductase